MSGNNASLHKKVISCEELLVKKSQFGDGATASSVDSLALGKNAVASAQGAVMIGSGTNAEQNYIKINNGVATNILLLGPDVNATQATNNNTGVTCHGTKGKITMAAAVVAGAGHDFVVTNAYAGAASKIFLSIVATTATATATRDALTIHITSQTGGAFTVHVYNGDAGDTTAAPVIHYLIMQ